MTEIKNLASVVAGDGGETARGSTIIIIDLEI